MARSSSVKSGCVLVTCCVFWWIYSLQTLTGNTTCVCFLPADRVLFCASKQMWPKTDQSTPDRSCGEPIGGSSVCASLPLDSAGRLERPIRRCCGGETRTLSGTWRFKMLRKAAALFQGSTFRPLIVIIVTQLLRRK